jgi:hypothetical protein
MSFDLDNQLRREGLRYHDLAGRTAGDLGDVNERTGRQRRRRRAAAGSAVAVALVVAVLAVYRQPGSSTVMSGGTGPTVTVPTSAAPEPTVAPTTAGSATSVAPPPSVSPTTGRPPASTTAPPALPDIRTVDFRNMTYPADTCMMGGLGDPPATSFTVRDGLWRGTASDGVYIADQPIYGDVNGDGHDEAVVPITCSTGVGSSNRIHPWVYTPDAAAATNVRRLAFPALTEAVIAQVGLPPDAYTRIGHASIANGTLTIDWNVWLPDDIAMAPSKRVRTHQRWTGTAWQTTTPPTVSDNVVGE